QGRVPQIGWPYAELFTSLASAAAAEDGPERVAERLLENLGQYYELSRNRAGKDEVPFSLVDVEQVEPVGQGLSRLAECLNHARASDIERASAKEVKALLSVSRHEHAVTGLIPSGPAAVEVLHTLRTYLVSSEAGGVATGRNETAETRLALERAALSDPA